MKTLVLCLLSVLASMASAKPRNPPPPDVKLNCTGGVTPKVSRVSGTSGVAVSQEVQVNVGKAAPQGVLMVDSSHVTVCTASINSPYRLITGNAMRDTRNIDGFADMNEQALDQALLFHPDRSGTNLVFTMYPVNGPIAGTANYRFYIVYKR